MAGMHSEIRQFVVDNFLFGQGDRPLADSRLVSRERHHRFDGVLELIPFLEQTYGIAVDDDELVPANLDSIHRVASFVERKVSLKGADVA